MLDLMSWNVASGERRALAGLKYQFPPASSRSVSTWIENLPHQLSSVQC